ncbi:MAG: metal ABC transporter ATP-binding protein [Synergistaceae bacterium]|nr:metal ABC transporter ATP-binding protein [Synergistaceae bacterium]MBQ3759327.1 metal ABC transporter ATP-binding protein [Synergistaceae bacterium]MBQ6115421.1 metal ABC transporter ATP-binding protein [Synergistaceae bacterium]MBQ6665946.1 metal ABC transporter ATP-binding protein [Synergistaceae bacterium]MBQ6980805.1 metal ABC transporter ATP-binding protein [Synergistaceae bacterium]
MTERLRIKDAVIKYGDNPAVNGVSLTAGAGEMIFITGANGSGKSTLTKGIAGLLPLSSGTLVRTPRMSYVPQYEEADRDFPARAGEIVLTGTQRPGKLFHTRNDRNQAESAMNALGIYDLADREIRTLSGGQLRRVFLARAICGKPELLLLDEPCAGLDAHSHEVLFSILRGMMSEGCAVVMVTHDISDIDGIPEGRVIRISGGRIAGYE